MTYKKGRRGDIIAFFKERADGAVALEEVCDALTGGGEGKSSIYRIVARLVDEGVLKKLTSENSRHCKYQYLGEHCSMHLHLKCTGCGRLIHLDHESSERLIGTVMALGDFSLDSSSLLFGKCKSCG